MHPLTQDLAENPACYDFFLAVRILQATSVGPRVGCATTPLDDSIYFLQQPGTSFVGSPIEGIRWQPKPTLLIRGFGMFGPKGCLPIWLNEFAHRQQLLRQAELPDSRLNRLKPGMELHPFWTESAFVAFCHLLQQRLTSFLYRAWEIHQLPPALDRIGETTKRQLSSAPPASRHPLLRSFLALSGYLALEEVEVSPPSRLAAAAAVEGFRRQEPLGATKEVPIRDSSQAALPSDWISRYQALWKSVSFHAGRFTASVRNPEGLQAILQCEFGVRFNIIEFVESWVTCPVEDRCRLVPSGRISSARLSVLGSRYSDCQTQFRVQVGPLPFQDYLRFLPGQPDHERVKDLVNIYCGDELGWDLQPILDRREVPPVVLGSSTGRSPLLGWTTWLVAKGSIRATHADEHILQTQPEMN